MNTPELYTTERSIGVNPISFCPSLKISVYIKSDDYLKFKNPEFREAMMEQIAESGKQSIKEMLGNLDLDFIYSPEYFSNSGDTDE